MSGGYISQKIEDEVLCFGIAFYKRRCIVKKNRVLEVPRLLAVIKTDDWGTFLKSYFVADEKVDSKGQILRPTPNTAPLICGACYNTQPEDLLTMA